MNFFELWEEATVPWESHCKPRPKASAGLQIQTRNILLWDNSVSHCTSVTFSLNKYLSLYGFLFHLYTFKILLVALPVVLVTTLEGLQHFLSVFPLFCFKVISNKSRRNHFYRMFPCTLPFGWICNLWYRGKSEQIGKQQTRNETFGFVGFCLGKLYSFKLVAP